jgi:hypothetical protein
MTWKQCLSGSLAVGLLLMMHGVVWAQGNEITAIVQPVSDIAVTVQIIAAIFASLLIIFTIFMYGRHDGAALMGIIFTIVCVVIALKAPDIIASFGATRAVAAGLTPVVITAWQQFGDDCQTLAVHGAWLWLGLKGLIHGRRTFRV